MSIFSITGLRYTTSIIGDHEYIGQIQVGISQEAETMFTLAEIPGSSTNEFRIPESAVVGLDSGSDDLSRFLLNWHDTNVHAFTIETVAGTTLDVLQTINQTTGVTELFVLSGDASLLPTDSASLNAFLTDAVATQVPADTVYDFLTLPGSTPLDVSTDPAENNNILFTDTPDTDSRLVLGDGDDVVFLGDGLDVIFAGAGDDWVSVEGTFPADSGSATPQFLSGGMGDDVLKFAGDGAGFMHGGGGNDRLVGGNFADIIYGAGDLPNSEDDDTIFGNDGNDELYGEWGDDRLYGGDGDDHLSTGHGDDVARGHAGDDTFEATSGTNKLYGGAGNDEFTLETGTQFVNAGSGDDVINMVSGNNTVWGGTGMDTFVFGAIDNLDGFQRIQDFEAGVDKIDLSGFRDDITSFAELLGVAKDKAYGVKIPGDVSIGIVGVELSELSESDFIF